MYLSFSGASLTPFGMRFTRDSVTVAVAMLAIGFWELHSPLGSVVDTDLIYMWGLFFTESGATGSGMSLQLFHRGAFPDAKTLSSNHESRSSKASINLSLLPFLFP